MTLEAIKMETEIPETVLTLEPGERGVIGTMMVVNENKEQVELTIQGEGAVIREKHIITAAEANTPSLKIYYMVMNMYLDPDSFETSYKPFLELSRELITTVPSTGMIMADIGECLIAGDHRGAFECCFALLQYEDVLEKAAGAPANDE